MPVFRAYGDDMPPFWLSRYENLRFFLAHREDANVPSQVAAFTGHAKMRKFSAPFQQELDSRNPRQLALVEVWLFSSSPDRKGVEVAVRKADAARMLVMKVQDGKPSVWVEAPPPSELPYTVSPTALVCYTPLTYTRDGEPRLFGSRPYVYITDDARPVAQCADVNARFIADYTAALADQELTIAEVTGVSFGNPAAANIEPTDLLATARDSVDPLRNLAECLEVGIAFMAADPGVQGAIRALLKMPMRANCCAHS